MSSDQPRNCSICSNPIPLNGDGHCPRCLLGFAAGSVPEPVEAGERIGESQQRFFGEYELLEELGRGGMGVVYRARQETLNRTVAIKMILAGQFATEKSIARFRVEAEAAAKLDHPQIVPVYELGEYETQHYFTMKLVDDAQPISEWAAMLPVDGMRFKKIAESIEKITRAIGYAHARGVLHCDIKSTNILVDKEGAPNLTDFGLAKISDASLKDLSLTNTAMGSPAYTSPEQATGETEATTASDLYGLGVVLYELITGRLPFEGDTAFAVLSKVKDVTPSDPRVHDPTIPQDLAAICLTCLEKSPKDRYRSAFLLAEDFSHFSRGEAVSVVPRSTVSLAWRWCLRNPVVSLLSAVLLIALIIGALGIAVQKKLTDQVNTELRETVKFLKWREIDNLVERGDQQVAIARLAADLREDPTHWQAASFAISILEQRPFPILSGPPLVGVRASALSPEGTVIVTADKLGIIRFLTVATGKPIRSALHFGKPVSALFFHPEEPLIVVSSDDAPCVIFNYESGQKISLRSGGELRLPDDGRCLILRKDASFARYLWDGTLISSVKLQNVKKPSISWALNSEGTRLAAWSASQLEGWDLMSAKPYFSERVRGRIRKGDVSGDGSCVAVAIGSHHYRVFEMESGETLLNHNTVDLSVSDANIENLSLDMTGDRVVITFNDGVSRVIDTHAGRPVSVAMIHDYSLYFSKKSSDRRRLLQASEQIRIRGWDLEDASLLCEPIYTNIPAEHIGFARSSTHMLTQNRQQTTVWQPSLRSLPETFIDPDGRFLGVSLVSNDGRWVSVGGSKSPYRAIVYDQKTGEQKYAFGLKGAPYGQLYDPRTQRLVVVTGNGFLESWSLTDGRHLWGPIETEGIRSSLMTSDGKMMIVGSPSGMIRVFASEDGSLLREMDLGVYPRSLKLFPGEQTLLSTGDAGVVATWDLLTGEQLVKFKGHQTLVISSCVSPDGKVIATASYDRTVRIWSATTGEPLSPLLSHLDQVSHLDFSPDSARLVTTSRDGRSRIWDSSDGAALTDWLPHNAAGVTCKFTADGKRVVVQYHDGFRLWDGFTGQPISVVYPAPMMTGIGIDSPGIRDIISPDGNEVRRSVNSNAVQLWDITLPSETCPAWFPDFLEAVCRLQLQPDGSLTLQPAEAQLEMREFVKTKQGWHAEWARKFLR